MSRTKSESRRLMLLYGVTAPTLLILYCYCLQGVWWEDGDCGGTVVWKHGDNECVLNLLLDSLGRRLPGISRSRVKNNIEFEFNVLLTVHSFIIL